MELPIEFTTTFVAYFALILGAVLPIYFGSFGSLSVFRASASKTKKSANQEDESDEEEEAVESLSSEDALWFPIMGSGVLFGLYLLFRFFSKEYINYLLTAYFSLLGWGAVAKALDSLAHISGISNVIPGNEKFKLRLTKHKGKELVFKVSFDYVTVGCAIISVFFTAYYVITKNWIASNLFGEAFASSGIQFLDLDDFKTGMILLAGLFVYDIFWVFGTEVMVTVAKNFDAPIKLLFPKDLTAEKFQFAMLGLGDIVIPGIFVALCLRFDYYLATQRVNRSSKSKSKGGLAGTKFPKPYFTACLIAYIAGLITTVSVMHVFKAAQPALLYLSPACILSVLITGAIRGELPEVFSYKSEMLKPKKD